MHDEQSRHDPGPDFDPATARVEVPPDSLIRLSGQLWKLVATLVVLLMAMAPAFLSWRHLVRGDTEAMWITTGLVLVAGLTVAALLSGVRCPSCGCRLAIKAIRERDQVTAIPWLLALRSCPMCGMRPPQ